MMIPEHSHPRQQLHQRFTTANYSLHQQLLRQAQQGCGARHSSSCRARHQRYCLTWQQQRQMVTPVWLALLMLFHTLIPCIQAVPDQHLKQSQQIVQQQHTDSAAHTPAAIDADLKTAPPAAAASWQALRDQARQRRQQFKQHVYQQQQLVQPLSTGQQQQKDEEHISQLPSILQDAPYPISNVDIFKQTASHKTISMQFNTHLIGLAATGTSIILPSTGTDLTNDLTVDMMVSSDRAADAETAASGPDQVGMTAGVINRDTVAAAATAGKTRSQQVTEGMEQQQQQEEEQQQTSGAAAVSLLDAYSRNLTGSAAAGLPAFDLYGSDSHSIDGSTASSSSSSSSKVMGGVDSNEAATAQTAAATAPMSRSLAQVEAATYPEQQQQPWPSAFGDGAATPAATTAAEQLLGPAAPPALVADLDIQQTAAAVVAAAAATPAVDTPVANAAQPTAGTGAGDGTTAAAATKQVAADTGVTGDAAAAQGAVGSTANAAAGVPAVVAAGPVEAGGTADSSSVGSSRAWKPQVLDAPVPKWPRLYSTVAPPAPTVAATARPAAVQALLSAAAAARTPQGISISGIPGLSLEDKILLARLLGHVINGTFDDIGQMDPTDTAYWEQLDAQLEKHTQVKHMFESIWYKCSKLNADLLMRASSAYDMEVEALQHILAWLGFPERHLPRPGEFANFDDLMTLLDGIGAKARLVTDPVPFLATTRPPLDRNGMPMLIHMTFKDKGQFARHHLLSLASWSKENPDHAILMYDDADLEAYLSTYDPSVLEIYSSLKTAVERSDLWRYVVMCKHGGVYTDADTLCVRPIQEWNTENHNDAEALFGVEDVFKRDPNHGDSGWGVSMGRFGIQFEQWTLAGAANHPVYCNMHSFISQRMKEEASKQSPVATTESENWSILHRTGPHVWTDSVLNWMHDQGIGFHEALVPGGRLVSNNTRILPGETFGCAAHFFSPAARLEEVYAMHMFRGVWRKRLDSGGAEADRHHLRLGF